MKSFYLIIFLSLSFVWNPVESDDDGGKSLIGTKPPEFKEIFWLSETPMHLSDLRGKIVLIRWWTASECPYCAASAPALNGFVEEFGDRGLVVIGLYHHKSDKPLTAKFVEEQYNRLGFQFPIGIDWGWRNLKTWWLISGERHWTSVSFLLDHEGIIHYIHPGGSYSAEVVEVFPKAQEDYNTLRSKIIHLLEKMPSKK